ncbi:DUF7222 domain-containing protein [Croceimicrobium sp.]|uniref:DUF7222 domain-containing protein n=1 Tax=Croceimicrobium sp. TaxID=2828340 RepID=UPI003BA9FFB8
MNTLPQQLKEQLEQITRRNPKSLRAAVAAEALEYDNIENFFHDLLHYGCISGVVSSLIYYKDTHAFYDAHYHEIEDLRYELEQEMGQPLQPQGDLKNWYAWLGFEETARKMMYELGINN